MIEIIEFMLNVLRTLEILFICCALACLCFSTIYLLVQETTNLKEWLQNRRSFALWLDMKNSEENTVIREDDSN